MVETSQTPDGVKKDIDLNTSSTHTRDKAIKIAQNARFIVDPDNKDCVRATFGNWCKAEYRLGWIVYINFKELLNSTPDKSKYAGIEKAITAIGEELIEKKQIPKSDRLSITSRLHPTDDGLPEIVNSVEQCLNDAELKYNQRFMAPSKSQLGNGQIAPRNPK